MWAPVNVPFQCIFYIDYIQICFFLIERDTHARTYTHTSARKHTGVHTRTTQQTHRRTHTQHTGVHTRTVRTHTHRIKNTEPTHFKKHTHTDTRHMDESYRTHARVMSRMNEGVHTRQNADSEVLQRVL